MKKFVSILMSLVLVLAFAACGNSAAPETPAPGSSAPETPAAQPADDGIVIGVSMAMLDENFSAIYHLLEENIKGIDPNAKVIMTNAESSIEKQMGDVDSLIIQEPDAILIGPVDAIGSKPAVQAIVNAGIPCADFLFNVDEPIPDVQAITSDELTNGKLQGEFVNEWLEANPDKNLVAGYIKGAAAQTEQLKRYDGFKEVCVDAWAAKDASRIRLVADTNCNWTAPEAMNVTEDWLQAFPEMNCIVTASDEMAVGVINVLKAQNIPLDEFLVVSVDGTENGQIHVREGSLDATIYTNYGLEMVKLAEIMYNMATGSNTYQKTEFIGEGAIQIITPENIDEIIPQ